MANSQKSAASPQFAESAEYENFIENLTAQLDAWKSSSEPSHEFARRMTGLMRTSHRQWAEKRR